MNSPGLTPPGPPAGANQRQRRLRQAALAKWVPITVGLILVVFAGFVLFLTRDLPDTHEIRELANSERVTTAFDANDRPLFTVYKEERIEVPLSKVSPDLIHAVIAVEDEHFYKHAGLDVPRIVAAVWTDLRTNERSQGGSTITQQLAKKMFLDDNKTLWRKARELALAVRIEREFTKDKILELYLNKVYFGHGYYGIEAASRGYYGKPASALTTDEAALLAGLVQAPSAYAPRSHPDRALTRRRVVLSRMVDAGYLHREEADRLSKIALHLHAPAPVDGFARYFKNYVTRQLVQRFGEDRVFEGGLRVFTTLDPDVQRIAERTVEEGLAKIEQQPGYKHPKFNAATAVGKAADEGRPSNQSTPYLQGALVAMDPSNGFVRALVGGRNYDDSSFDRATQARRQAGSAFKPFIYAAAIESGYTPATLLTDLESAKETDWMPDEAHGNSFDSITLQMALRTSSNRAAVRLLSQVGIGQTVNYVKRFGFASAPAVPSLALGTADVSVLAMTAGYAAFANGGRVPEPVAIRRIETADGHVLFQSSAVPSPVISETTAFIVAQMLADVITSGTGYRVRQEGFTLPAGGKTGTTDDFRDAWFAGFTPDLVAAVWTGFDQPQQILSNGFAGDLAAPMWARFMKAAVKPAPAPRGGQVRQATWLPQPANVVTARICRLSGQLASEGCTHVQTIDKNGETIEKSMVVTEYFRRGTEPTQYCTMHPDEIIAPSFEQTGAPGGGFSGALRAIGKGLGAIVR